MSTPVVAVTRPIHPAGLADLEKYFTVRTHPNRVMSERELKQFVQGADAVVTLLTDPVTEAVMQAAGPQLKIIAQYAVGYNNIDLVAAQKFGIVVTNTPGEFSAPAVAEQAFALMLAAARHLVPADRFMRAGRYRQWDPNLFLGLQLTGQTLGIVGSGQIGGLFAQMCYSGLQMNVLYCDLVKNTLLENATHAKKVEMATLLKKADVISLHVPLLPATHHLIGATELNLLKETAILINTSRGPVIDEKALVVALKSKKFYAAALDVFEFEPRLATGLSRLANVVVTPHISSATETAREAMSRCVAANIRAVLDGKMAISPVQ